MLALTMSEDRVSMQPRRQQIIEGLQKLPGVCMRVCERSIGLDPVCVCMVVWIEAIIYNIIICGIL